MGYSASGWGRRIKSALKIDEDNVWRRYVKCPVAITKVFTVKGVGKMQGNLKYIYIDEFETKDVMRKYLGEVYYKKTWECWIILQVLSISYLQLKFT